MKLSSMVLPAVLALAPAALPLRGVTEAPVRQVPEGPAPENQEEPPSPNREFEPGPGRIPPNTHPMALALWNRLIGATRPLVSPEAQEEGVRAFDVRFDVLQRRTSVDQRSPGSVDGKTRVKWLRPDYVELTLEQGSLKQTGYGPSGYYINTEDGAIDINRDRDFKTDRELVQRTISLAKNLAGLADFSNLVLLELHAMEDPPNGEFPRQFMETNPKKLDWLLVLTPDFQLSEELAGGRAGPGGRDIYYVSIGLDRKSNEPRMIHIAKKPVPTKPTPPEQLVELRSPKRLDGWWLPSSMFLWERQRLAKDPALQRFSDAPADREAYVLSGSHINPPVLAAEFDPQTKPSKR